MRWLQFQGNPLKIITEGVEAGDGGGNTELVKGIQEHLEAPTVSILRLIQFLSLEGRA